MFYIAVLCLDLLPGMGTKIQFDSLLPMRDLNEDSGGCSWPMYYSDSIALANNHNNNGFRPSSMAEPCFGYDKDVMRRTILQHESVFKSQVYELHRLYRIQRDLIEEFKRKELNRNRILVDASFSSSPLASQITYDDARKWQIPNLPSASVVEDNGHSPMSSRRGNYSQAGPVPSQNGHYSWNIELAEIRPVKIRKKMIDLRLPADEYIDTEETVEIKDNRDEKTESRGNFLRINSGSRSGNGLADLNEPINVQEMNGYAYGCPRVLHDRRKISSVSSTKDISPHSDNIGSHRGWPLHPSGAAGHYSAQKSTYPFLQPGNGVGPSHHMRNLFNDSQTVTGLRHSGQSTMGSWRERTFIDLEADASSHEVIFEPSLASYGSLGPLNYQKAASTQSLHPQRQRFPVDRLLSEDRSRLNHNGFYHGSSSSAANDNQLNSSGIRFNSYHVGSDMKLARDVDLNVAVENTEHSSSLPWLNSGRDSKTNGGFLKPVIIKDDPRNGSCSNNSGTMKIGVGDSSANRKILGGSIFYEACSNGDRSDEEKGREGRSVRILDINVPCDPAALSEEDESAEDGIRTEVSGGYKCQIDLNMSVSEDKEECSVRLSSRWDAKVPPMIDLEAPAIPEFDDDDDEEKLPEETRNRNQNEELEKMAAEAIVAISSAEKGSGNILQWFAETIQAYGDNVDEKLENFLRNDSNGGASSMEEFDYFELMTLRLPEVKEGEYMPMPLVPEDLKFEEPLGPVAPLSQRPRRGNARKGRQRRDFQRDILPGLTSLSRHEVTEDLQTFDGLMRVMGVSWTPRRKTGSTRGRRRLVPPGPTIPPPSAQVTHNPVYYPSPSDHNPDSSNNSIETGFEDRSLTGWGKMTRRPRRQRLPAGNRSHAPFA